jgi:alginate O-acetyltransferase complex protein AlgI
MAFVPVYILILLGTIIIDYIAGIMIDNASGAKRKWFLVMSIVANVGVLAFFKYYNFFTDNINYLFNSAHINSYMPLLNIILPIGLSFHTFQAMSYTIEVYRGNQKAERHFGIYSLYVMFYPQLVAGPIERPQNLLHQFHQHHDLEYNNVATGMRQMLWGMVKKVVIADRLALMTDPIFNYPRNYSGIALILAAIFFAFEIFCDFSGYSDIAIGAARVMGYKLMTNFDHPFHSKSITEFWRRWHISLSTWFYDYVFNPLITSLRHWGKKAVAFGLLLTFFLSGFWHGAGWKFIIYGLIHGVAIVYEFYTKKYRKRIFKQMPLWLNNGISRGLTFSYVAFSWVFFRAQNVKDAFFIVRKMTNAPVELFHIVQTRKIAFLHLPSLINIILPCTALILFLEIINFLQIKYNFQERFNKIPSFIRFIFYQCGVIAVLFFGIHAKHQFIYFQF